MPNLNRMQQKTLINGVPCLEGSNNIFRDLGFPEAEALSLLARSELMMAIEKTIKERELTRAEAAKLLGVGQSRLSDLYNGKMERFTIDMLMKWLAKLGKRVTITVDDQEVA